MINVNNYQYYNYQIGWNEKDYFWTEKIMSYETQRKQRTRASSGEKIGAREEQEDYAAICRGITGPIRILKGACSAPTEESKI